MIGLGDLPGGPINSTAGDVSEVGEVVVGASASESGWAAFRWTDPATGGSGMTRIGELPGGGFSSGAGGVSFDGQVIVGGSQSEFSALSEELEAFRWVSPGPMIGLGGLPGLRVVSAASGVSADGSILCGYANGDGLFLGYHTSVRWTRSEGFVSIGDLPGGLQSGEALAISPDGSVIVGFSSGADGYHAYRWIDPNAGGVGMQDLGDLPGGSLHFSRAYGVSADGKAVVGESDTERTLEAFIWFENRGMLNLRAYLEDEIGLDLKDWTLYAAYDITPDGRTIVGYGSSPAGFQEAWIAHLGSPAKLGDLNDDGDVDGFDLAILLAAWGRCQEQVRCLGDLKQDGFVNGTDLSTLLAAWG
jgi:probable HAF family extracellular repeat protein